MYSHERDLVHWKCIYYHYYPYTHTHTHTHTHTCTHTHLHAHTHKRTHTNTQTTFTQLEQSLKIFLLRGSGLMHPGQHVSSVAQRVVRVKLYGAGSAAGTCNTTTRQSAGGKKCSLREIIMLGNTSRTLCLAALP